MRDHRSEMSADELAAGERALRDITREMAISGREFRPTKARTRKRANRARSRRKQQAASRRRNRR